MNCGQVISHRDPYSVLSSVLRRSSAPDNFNVPDPSNSNARLVNVGGYYNNSVDNAGLAYANYNNLNNANTNYGSRLTLTLAINLRSSVISQ